jgi:hypothetical protein
MDRANAPVVSRRVKGLTRHVATVVELACNVKILATSVKMARTAIRIVRLHSMNNLHGASDDDNTKPDQ